MGEKLIKSKKRVQDFAEVYTPAWLVKDMCALIPQECYDLEHTFLEPSCGNGNFLAHILDRKLESAVSPEDALKALSTLYGVDILLDNVEECRLRLLSICEKFNNWTEKHTEEAKKILSFNIHCGNFLEDDIPFIDKPKPQEQGWLF